VARSRALGPPRDSGAFNDRLCAALLAIFIMSGFGKGFGCRPEHEWSTRYKAGVRKPPKKEPAGKG
jgi:hypothetical protein